jgi:hypothetical protein
VTILTDRELWACAHELVEQHGRGAVLKAGERILDLEADGDVAGHTAWMMILERIVKLLRKEPEAGERMQ